MRKKKIRLIFLIILWIIFLNGCHNSKGKTNSLKPTSQAIPVSVYIVPQPTDVPIKLEYPAKTRSYYHTVICARITGFLKKMLVKEGEYVKKGEPLFLIEKDVYEAEYESAKAQLERAEAEFERAKRDWERIKASYEARVVSEEDRDKAWAMYKSAKANLDMARARLKQAKINLNYTTVRALISGIVGKRLIDPGNLVQPGTPLVVINKIDPIYVEFSIPDRDLWNYGFRDKKSYEKLKKLIAKIKFEDGRIYKRNGKIDFVDSVLDKETASLKIRAVFPNPEREILPNSFVRIVLEGIKRKNVIFIPQRCVIQTPVGETVYVVKGNKAIVRSVKLGETYKDYYIIEKGLKPGEKVIADNLLKLKPGIPVKIDKIVKK